MYKRPKTLTIVIDACFSGASQSGMVVKNASPISLEIPLPVLRLKDAVVFTSSSIGQISSWYPEQKHGPFTYFFLKTIKTTIASGKPLISGDIEKSRLGPESINDYALRFYNREQMPQVVGNKSLVLLQ